MSDFESFQNVTSQLMSQYGLSNIHAFTPIVCDPFVKVKSGLEGATAYAFECDEGSFVLKVHRKEKETAALKVEEQFLSWAQTKNFSLAPRLLRTQSGELRGEIDGRACHLMGRIEGNYRTSWINPALSEEALRASGRALALYHNFVSDLPAKDLALDPGPPGSILVHGDYHPGNLIFQKEGNRVRLTGIVDYEFGRFEDAHYDLGYALVTFASRTGPDGAEIDTSAWFCFFNGYQSVRRAISSSKPLTEYAQLSCGLILEWLEERLRQAKVEEVSQIRDAVTHFMSLKTRLSKMGVIIH